MVAAASLVKAVSSTTDSQLTEWGSHARRYDQHRPHQLESCGPLGPEVSDVLRCRVGLRTHDSNYLNVPTMWAKACLCRALQHRIEGHHWPGSLKAATSRELSF